MLSKDFKEFIELLNEHDVRYLVVGGYAVAYYGHPRYTKDLEIWIDSSERNAQALVAALDDFGFGSLGVSIGDFMGESQVVQLGYPPNRIDILTGADGVVFDDCYERRDVVELAGTKVNFIGLEHLCANKRATGRLQDLADLKALEAEE